VKKFRFIGMQLTKGGLTNGRTGGAASSKERRDEPMFGRTEHLGYIHVQLVRDNATDGGNEKYEDVDVAIEERVGSDQKYGC
jgi:hypothetical protein